MDKIILGQALPPVGITLRDDLAGVFGLAFAVPAERADIDFRLGEITRRDGKRVIRKRHIDSFRAGPDTHTIGALPGGLQ